MFSPGPRVDEIEACTPAKFICTSCFFFITKKEVWIQLLYLRIIVSLQNQCFKIPNNYNYNVKIWVFLMTLLRLNWFSATELHEYNHFFSFFFWSPVTDLIWVCKFYASKHRVTGNPHRELLQTGPNYHDPKISVRQCHFSIYVPLWPCFVYLYLYIWIGLAILKI